MFRCLGADWHPIIGDPTVFGWLTVLSYLICAILAAILWHRRPERVPRNFWALTTVLMAFMALNKQLDLQTALTSTMRCLSLAQGWYDVRKVAQVIFVVVMAGAGVLLYWRGVRAMRRYRRSHFWAQIGLGFVVIYVLIRATSFHWIDMLTRAHIGGASANFLLENTGLLLIAINAILLLTGRIKVEALLLTPKSMIHRPKPAKTGKAGAAEAPSFPVDPDGG